MLHVRCKNNAYHAVSDLDILESPVPFSTILQEAAVRQPLSLPGAYSAVTSGASTELGNSAAAHSERKGPIAN